MDEPFTYNMLTEDQHWNCIYTGKGSIKKFLIRYSTDTNHVPAINFEQINSLDQNVCNDHNHLTCQSLEQKSECLEVLL